MTTINLRGKGGKGGKGGKDVGKAGLAAPEGFKNLYDYEEERRRMAGKVFQKMLEAEVHSLKDMFLLWYGKSKRVTAEIDVKEQEFIDFFKEILPNKLSEKQMRHFFELYRNKPPAGKEKDEQFRAISIKALSFNFEKYRKSQTEVANIMSEKALKERYISLKNYSADFNVPRLRCRPTTPSSRRP